MKKKKLVRKPKRETVSAVAQPAAVSDVSGPFEASKSLNASSVGASGLASGETSGLAAGPSKTSAQPESSVQPGRGTGLWRSGIIVFAALAAFGVVMSGYFIADDTWQLQFAYRVFHGEWRLIAENFTHSYLGLPSMDFYRPLLGLTYLADYAVYHMAAWGFYLTNILLAASAGVILYFLLRRLALDNGYPKAESMAFCSALLYTVTPLHAEDICWISGRADLLAAPLFLYSLFAAAKGRDWASGKVNIKPYLLSLVAFALSLLSKESAVTVPLVVVAIYIYYRLGEKGRGTYELKLFDSLKKFALYLSPYAVLAGLYLCLRKVVLGSFIGGYTGDMGQALDRWLWFRWLDPVHFLRMAFPVAKETFHTWNLTVDQTPTYAILGSVYAVIVSILIIRITTQKLQWRLPFFLILWLVASVLPVLKLWGMDSDLHNERVLYLFTAPLIALLPALVFAPKVTERPTMVKNNMVLGESVEEFLTLLGNWSFYALTVCLIAASALVSYNWVLAGHQVKAIRDKTTALIAQKVATEQGADQRLIVGSTPKDYLGCHVLMGGCNVLELVEKPFIDKHLGQYLVQFQRALVGPGEIVNSTRFKIELSAHKKHEAYFWENDLRDYKKVEYEDPGLETAQSIDLPIAMDQKASDKFSAKPPGFWYADPVKKADVKILHGTPVMAMGKLNFQGGDGMMISGLDVNPLAYDYLSMLITLPQAQLTTGVYVSFDDKQSADAPFVEEPQVCKLLQVPQSQVGKPHDQAKLDIRLSHFAKWYSYQKIRRLKLTFSNVEAVAVSNLRLSDDSKLMPLLLVMKGSPRASGEYFVTDKDPVKFVVANNKTEGVTSASIQVSKVNQSWDAFVTQRDKGRDVVVNQIYTVPLQDGRAYFMLDPKVYAKTGFYDVRAALLNDKNEIVSDWSDMVTLYRPDSTGKAATFCADY